MKLSERTSPWSLLVVDDDADTRDVVSRYFRQLGYVVRSAANGHEAVGSVVNQTPDLIILDVRMPEVDGVGFLNIVRSYFRWSTLPVVLLTAHAEGHVVDEALRLGVDHVFKKASYRLADVQKRIEEILTSKQNAERQSG